MRDLQAAVERQLLARRDAAGAIELWRRLWATYEQGGQEALEELLGDLAAEPAGEDEP